MRTAADEAERIGNEERSYLSLALIGKDDGHGTASVFGNDGIVRVGESEGELAAGDSVGHLLVAGHDLHFVLPHIGVELFRLIVAPSGKQNGSMCGAGAEERPG